MPAERPPRGGLHHHGPRCTRATRTRLFHAGLQATGLLLGDVDALLEDDGLRLHRRPHARAGAVAPSSARPSELRRP